MAASTSSLWRGPFLIMAVLATSFWILSQKGCDFMPAVTPLHALANVDSPPSRPVVSSMKGREPVFTQAPQLISQSSEQKSRSLQHAAALLKQASGIIGKNEEQAIRLIRQTIAILKREVIQGAEEPDYDRVSIRSLPSLSKTFEPEVGTAAPP